MSLGAAAVAVTLAAASLAAGPRVGDGNISRAELRFDSRSAAYRSPTGAVPAGTTVRFRFRTRAKDVASVRMRVYDLDSNRERLVALRRVRRNASCEQASLAKRRCDWWQTTLANPRPATVWYRFVVRDGRRTLYYEDDTKALDGGVGAATAISDDVSWALTVYDPAFSTPSWARSAVVYQIFPDRFRNGDASNDPRTGDPRYDEPVLALPWSSLPEGYCRNYDGGGCNQGPRGRDYTGGDLEGVIRRLDYLRELGVTAIYFNPIFAARSNHRYDTADFRTIDRYLGTNADFERLAREARARGIRLILDGVFNHVSSDSPWFDRYRRYPTTGACEATASPFRPWFLFTGTGSGPCAGGAYTSWAGFDSLPVLNKATAAVREELVTGADSVARLWLRLGASGWRLDVAGDQSFPNAWWSEFRRVVKEADGDALIVGELWQKDSTLLRGLRGDRFDGVMNYRLRDAVLGLLAPRDFDAKGFANSGSPIPPSRFAARLASVYEDYPRPAWSGLMNLIDSHDTERALWTLTPGVETRAAKEQNAGNVAAGKARLRLAALIQFTVPGMPTVYYGDEAGVTGDDDPDDRRTFPWPDAGGVPDEQLTAYYRSLAQLRRATSPLVDGDFRVLGADDRAGTVAFARVAAAQTAVVALNRSAIPREVAVRVAGVVPDGATLISAFGGGPNVTVQGGIARVRVEPLAGAVYATPVR